MAPTLLPNIRRRLLGDPSAAYSPAGFDDESSMNAPPAGPYAPPSTTATASPVTSPSPTPSPMGAYAARLGDVSKQLSSAYAAPHAGTLRQVLGAFVGARNPALGGIISGETQRARSIEPLQQEYSLIANVIAANRAAQTSDIQNQERLDQGAYYRARANNTESPVPKTPQEMAVADYITKVNPATKKNYTPSEALKQVTQDVQDTKPERATPAGLTYDNGIPVTYKDATGKAFDINDPNLPPEGKAMVDTANKAHLQHVKESADAQARAAANANQRQQQTFSRQDVKDHDKAYVQPAEGVEKSYQMMNDAYNEYQQARAQGKELPTGAQSMLALSTHLSTTFGNVKGARVTKDMIEHHLGARGISDSALVAVQKLTNGDVLSPDQWTAFHDLIGKSRKLSWQTAVKEAKRKNIPTDFLPNDLQGLTGDSGTTSSTTQSVKPTHIWTPQGLQATPTTP